MPESESLFGAWEPLTPRGVAAFARATSGRLFVVQFLVALLVAAAVVWFLSHAWFPIVRQAITHLPDTGELRAGRLDWHGDSPRLLAEGRFLAFSVDLANSGGIRSPAHVQIELGQEGFFIHSILGYREVKYPVRWRLALNREELAPWWGAWQPPLFGLTVVGVVAGLLLSWLALATAYSLPVWVLGFFTNRDLKLRECWQLAGAALMPGALLMAAGILCYDFGVVDLVGLVFLLAGHFVLGWIYLFIGPLFLPRSATAQANEKNPFTRTGVIK